jgi:hypothetical protein
MRGAGGSEGGIGMFLLGFIMMCAGGYMLFQAINVSSTFGMRTGLYSYKVLGTMRTLNTGMILIPFMIGISMIFYNFKSIIGWLLSVGAISALVIGVIASINLHMRSMTLFELVTMLVLFLGGLGLFLRSFKNYS